MNKSKDCTVASTYDGTLSTRKQTTDNPSHIQNVTKTQPFNLIPVMPPNKNKSVVAKSGGLPELSKPASVREFKVPSQPVKSGNNSSRSSQTSIAPAQVQDESMMRVDQAIVAIGKSDLKVTHYDSAVESKEHSAQFPSTHDKSSDLSFGERARSTSTRETVDEQSIISHSSDVIKYQKRVNEMLC